MKITKVRGHLRRGRPVRTHVRKIKKRKSTKWGWEKGPLYVRETVEEKERF